MLILAIDSAASACGACVWQDGKILAQTREAMERGQDRRLMPLILATMQTARKTFAQLDRIGVTRGPGSFTGVRIGLAAARGIGIASGKPVVGIDRFSIYRRMQPADSGATMIVIESKRAELFCRFYAGENAEPPQMLLPAQILEYRQRYPKLIFTGDMPQFSSATPNHASEAAICAALAAEAANTDEFAPSPLYLRPPDVTLQKQAAS